MDLFRLLLTILVGSAAGMMGGALGINGSFAMLPSIMFLNIVTDYSTAIGTILLAALPPLSLLAVIEYYKRKKVDVAVSITLGICYFIAAKFGAKLNPKFTGKSLKYTTTVIFLLCALYFFISAYNDKGTKQGFSLHV